MPTLSQFYGITIKMYFQKSEHRPPHFHATYGGHEAEFSIETGELLAGSMPMGARRLVRKWARINRKELNSIWNTQQFNNIKPLE